MRHLISMILLILGTAATAQELSLVGKVLQETEHDRTLISKPGWLRGLHVVGSTPVQKDYSLLLAPVPGQWTEFCARVTSISGDYSAIVEFAPTETAETARSAELKIFSERDTARTSTHADGGVVLESGKCSDDRMPNDGLRQYSASFWNVANTPAVEDDNAQLVLNMNVARADQIVATASIGGALAPVACEKLASPEALAFNYQCRIAVPLDALRSSTALEVDFSYERLYRGRVAEPRRARIFVGLLSDIDPGAYQ